jgi:hypothetical protein
MFTELKKFKLHIIIVVVLLIVFVGFVIPMVALYKKKSQSSNDLTPIIASTSLQEMQEESGFKSVFVPNYGGATSTQLKHVVRGDRSGFENVPDHILMQDDTAMTHFSCRGSARSSLGYPASNSILKHSALARSKE